MNVFFNIDYARNVTDVNYQQDCRSSGGVADGNRCFARSHKLYMYKVEMFVMSLGLAIGCKGHYPCSIADEKNFCQN